MQEKLITIKKVALNNNCPECYSTKGLYLTFKQKFVETKFYKSITSEIKHIIECNTCNTVIYPVKWTNDIERVFEYQKKTFVPKKSSIYLKKTAWVIITTIIVLVITGIVITIYSKL